MSVWILTAAVGLLAGIASFALTPWIRKAAHAFGLVDRPGAHKQHAGRPALFGGAAIFAATWGLVFLGLTATGVAWVLGTLDRFLGDFAGDVRNISRVGVALALLFFGSLLSALWGALDDLWPGGLSAAPKLAGQFLAAIVTVAGGAHCQFLPGGFWINAIASVVWIVLVINAFNFIDNMDGLCAGVALVSSAVLLFLALLQRQYFMGLLLASFLGATAGFLRFNFPPASIFLGDLGSHVIGHFLGAVTLLLSYTAGAGEATLAVLMPPVVLALPLLDLVRVSVIRIREHRPIWVGDRRHLSHRLRRDVGSDRAVVIRLYLLASCLGGNALLLQGAAAWQGALVGFQTLCLGALVWLLLDGSRPKAHS
ncbi:MAG: MraY family glycosyltransferase [Planctomycetota bacterium]